jgi:hypothetical protein
MDWNQFRNAMDSLGNQIRQVDCKTAPTVKDRLDTFRDKLLEEQTNYALGSEAYLNRLDELFETLDQQGCLIPKGSEGEIGTYFDELVKHAMIAGDYTVLEKWGVQPFIDTGVKAGLGYPKSTFIGLFEWNASSGEVPASARYYQYLAQAFIERLSD